MILTSSAKFKAFLAICIPMSLAKFWQETLYLMSYFLEKDFNASTSMLLSAAKYQPLGVAVGYLVTAILIDRIGIQKVLSKALFLFSLIVIVLSQSASIEMLYVYRFAMGCCIGLIYNASFGGLSIIFEKHELPKKTSVLYMFAFGSTVLSPMILTGTQDLFSWRILLLMIAGLTCISSWLVWKYFPQKSNDISLQQYVKQAVSLVRNKAFLLMSLTGVLYMAGFYGFVSMFVNNLKVCNISSEISKFIITDMQFVGRLILFMVTTWGGYRLTQSNIPSYLKGCLCIIGMCSSVLLVYLYYNNTLYGDEHFMSSVIEYASVGKHVFPIIFTSISGIWLFWLYAATMGIGQPANKAKALSIAGKDMGGTAQAILGSMQAFSEFLFASIAQYIWPFGAFIFLSFIVFSSVLIFTGITLKQKDGSFA